MDDGSWRRLRDEDPQAFFRRLRSETLPQVWSMCLRLLQDRTLAEDACQECYLRVWRSLERFRGEARLSTWILAIAIRCCRDLQKKEYRPERPRPSADGELPVQAGACEARQREEEDLVERLLKGLSPGDRELVLLFYMENHSVAEVSRLTGKGRGAVKTALHRARRRLAGRLLELEEEG